MQEQWHIAKTVIEHVQSREQWHGSYYELSMAYPLLSQPERLRLLQYAWSDTNLLGVAETPDQFGQPWHDPATIDTTDARHAYGYIRLTDGQIVGCGSYFTSWGDITWFSLYIPLCQLDQLFPVHYPLTPEDNQWMSIVDASLATPGAHIYRAMAFKVAALGEDISGFPIQDILAHMADSPNLLVPEALFEQNNIAPRSKNIGEKLWWTGG
jgi:hypothetical protein